MKLTIFFVLALSAFAQQEPNSDLKKPTPIPATEQESISRQMLTVQMNANRVVQLQLQSEQAKKEFEEASKAWEQTLSALREKYHAAGCDLGLDKSWICIQKK